MRWARWTGRDEGSVETVQERPAPEPIERVTPGVAAFFDRVSEDRSHAVLDLGPASGTSLRVYGRFARWIRFADVLGDPNSPTSWLDEPDALPANPERPYDLVFAWDALDRLPPEERPELVKRLVEVTAPDARLFVVVESPDDSTLDLWRFSLADVDRMRYENSGIPRPPFPPVGPADVKRLLEPFHVQRAFSSQSGLREYLAVREGARPKSL